MVARRLHITEVWQGIWVTGDDQKNVYVCDNTIEGRDVWPWVYNADATSHWDDEAIQLHGDGIDACHNRIVGFGDTIIQKKPGARSFDFYGNDIYDSWDGTELEEGSGNVRFYNNRLTNVNDGASMQPIYGGPAYVMRNVVYNAVSEQMKIHAEGDGSGGFKEPSGMLIFHNTFVSPTIDLTDETPATIHNFLMANNLFVGPHTLTSGKAAEYTTPVDHGMFDYNGYFPDGLFWLGTIAGTRVQYDNFAGLQAGGVFEAHGSLVDAAVFANGEVGPDDPMTKHPPFDATLSASSSALDKGLVLPGLDDRFGGSAPDLGALESGCAPPVYGPRPDGDEDREAPIDCDPATAGGGDGTGNDGASATTSGCGCAPGSGIPGSGAALMIGVAWALARRRDLRSPNARA